MTARVLSILIGGAVAFSACSSSDKSAPAPAGPPADAAHHEEAGVRFTCNNPQDLLSAADQQPTGFVLCSNNVTVPLLHRPEIKACTSTLPRPTGCVGVGSGTDAGTQLGYCKSDGDCTQGVEGHCNTTQRNTTCSCYYGCKADADCGAGKLCACGNPTGECVGAQCLSDADCGAGKLCLSSSDGVCGRVFACQTKEDTCAGDKDCKQPPYSQCTFADGHRQCKIPPNCGF